MSAPATVPDSCQPGPAFPWKLLFSIAALTLLIRVLYLIILQTWNFPDERAFGFEMGRIGKWLAEGRGFTLDGVSPSAKFPPAYPFLVGRVFHLFGVYTTAAAVALFTLQSICSAGIAVCLTILGTHLFGRTTGLIAGFVWAFYPTSIFYSVMQIWYSEVALFLVLLVATVAVTATNPLTFRRIATLGGLSGLVVLTDSTVGLYLPVLLFWLLVARRVQIWKMPLFVIVWGLAALIITSPWMTRNWLVFGSPRLAKSNLGLELFTGNSPFSWGANDRAEIAKTFAALDQEELAYHRAQSELEYNHYLQNKALEWIRAHPVRFAGLTALRVSYFWVRIPTLGWKSWLRAAYFSFFLLLALYGLWYGLRRRWELAPVWLFLLLYPVPYYLTHVARGRYTYPVEPFVILLAAIPLAIWLTAMRRQRTSDVASQMIPVDAIR